jgi:hypothetical protein
MQEPAIASPEVKFTSQSFATAFELESSTLPQNLTDAI